MENSVLNFGSRKTVQIAMAQVLASLIISSVFCAQRVIETMVSGGARPWGRGRSGGL